MTAMAQSLDSFHPAQTRVHLIGVAGSGMSGLAWLFMQLGYQVSGCDRVTTSETEKLQQAGLEFFSPQTAESVRRADLVVHTSAVKLGNPAYDEAVRLGLPVWRRAEALAAIMRTRQGMVISGTHGKTTTSSMMAHVLRQAGLHPSHYVGAEIPILGANATYDPKGQLFVAEGDESDGTLVEFTPRFSVVLNVEAEHLDHYGSLDQIVSVFKKLCAQTAETIFYCADDAGACRVVEGRADTVSFGFSEKADYRAIDLVRVGRSTSATVLRRGQPLGELVLNIPGEHNISNALSVIALATEQGVDFEKIKSALNTFTGAKRRFEVRYQSPRFSVVDDYGHHPSEITATLRAARDQNPGRLVVLFQPHRYTRTQLLADEFGAAFRQADLVFITDVYAASEPPIPGISGHTIIDAIAQHSPAVKALSAPQVASAHRVIGPHLRPGDLIITLGAGHVHQCATQLSQDLARFDDMLNALAEPDGVARLYEPMNRHTTMLIGGPAQYWIEPHTTAGFQRLVTHLREKGIPIRVVGRGSNLLVRDGGIPGAVIHPAKGEFADVEVQDDTLICGAGARLQKLAMTARQASLGGFEWMEGVPGNVGGALRMNAGAMGVQMFDQVVSVDFIDSLGRLVTKTRDQIEAHYRHVPEFSNHYAVRATLRGEPAAREAIDSLLQVSKNKRRTTQPIAASAGCIFKNPACSGAGQLIDELGLKGYRIGAAAISPVHANFIVNEGGATAADVIALIEHVKGIALGQRGVTLETEVQILGEET
jgi:UDP-N-acetylmuramate--L-alanine ligase/UDP-N-acetylenolpyruvoylglucosamine reductase